MIHALRSLLLVAVLAPLAGCQTNSASVANADPFHGTDPFQMAESQAVAKPGMDVWRQPDAMGTASMQNATTSSRATAQRPGWSSTRHVTHPEYQVTSNPAVQTVAAEDPFFQPTEVEESAVQTADYLTTRPKLSASTADRPEFADEPSSSVSAEWWR